MVRSVVPPQSEPRAQIHPQYRQEVVSVKTKGSPFVAATV